MDLSRRQLFRFGAAAVLTAVVAPVAFAASAPVLWGDGEHDDTEALQAALDGKPVTVAGERIVIREGQFEGGTYLVKDTIYVRGEGFHMKDVELIAAKGFRGQYLLHTQTTYSVFENLRLDGRNIDLAAAWRVSGPVPAIA